MVIEETEDYFLFSCLEVCIALLLFCAILWRRRRETDEKEAPRFSLLQREAAVTNFRKSKSYINHTDLHSPNKSTLMVLPCRWLVFSEIMWSMWSVAMLLGCRLDRFGVVYSPFEYGVVKLFALPRVKRPPRPPNWNRMNSIINQLHEVKDKKVSDEINEIRNNKRNKLLSTLGSDSLLTMQREAELMDELKNYCWGKHNAG